MFADLWISRFASALHVITLLEGCLRFMLFGACEIFAARKKRGGILWSFQSRIEILLGS